MARYKLLSVRGLVASYHDHMPVLHEVDLDVDEHHVVTILGSNGAGKSSLLRAISGGLTPTAGKVEFAREDITGIDSHEAVEHGLTLVPSGRQVFPEMTVEENLLVGAHRFRREKNRVRRLLNEAYERIPLLKEVSQRPAGRLSGGQQQIVSIARGLMAAPRLLMIDEASMGLDPRSIAEVERILLDLRDQGVTLLLVEKLARLATELSDHMVVLKHGRVIISGPTPEVSTHPLVEAAYLGSPGTAG